MRRDICIYTASGDTALAKNYDDMIKRILLADDDADDKLLFEEVFADLPPNEYALVTAKNGEEVIEFLTNTINEDELPHLIILDQNMPLRSGKETLTYLRASSRYQNIPVIIYSTYNDGNFVEECQSLGVTAVVSKPDSYEGYVQMINTFLKYTEGRSESENINRQSGIFNSNNVIPKIHPE